MEIRAKCTGGHLFLHYAIARNWEERKATYASYLAGLCLDDMSCHSVSKILEETEGFMGEQNRLRVENYRGESWINSGHPWHDDDEYPIEVAESFGDLEYSVTAHVNHTECLRKRNEHRDEVGERLYTGVKQGSMLFFEGGITQLEEGVELEEGEVPPWFCLYTKLQYNRSTSRPEQDSWNLVPAGSPRYFTVGGEVQYNHGDFDDLDPLFVDYAGNLTGTEKQQLIVNVMGEEVVVDETPEWASGHGDIDRYYFKSLHSNIFENNIFMYSYCLIKVEGNHFKIQLRSSGWLIEGPNDVVFYMPSEKFKEWFDIVKEK
jgi:hypothetical protein